MPQPAIDRDKRARRADVADDEVAAGVIAPEQQAVGAAEPAEGRVVRLPRVRPLIDRFGASSSELRQVITAYRRYAWAYDTLFGAVFQRGRAMTVERVNAHAGGRVLEVGVGTGLSLMRYRPEWRITGIDVSAEMLAIGQRRLKSQGLTHVDGLLRMDARRLAFDDAAFDMVVAMYVMSVAPSPRECLAEMARVCAPGGTILVCNHFVRSSERLVAPLLEPLSRWLGWHPNFSLATLLEGSPLEVVGNEPVPPVGLFRLITLRKPLHSPT